MPIYEYVCQDCGVETEIMQRISDAPETVCPSCGKSALTKVVSAAGFRLSGGGWYETDFKSGNKKNLTADSKADSGASAGAACTPSGCDKPGCAAA
ncbi:zinc ribbon domain-containing protein [Solimonas fluminis]|uniref:Zinc ribbon domain-containing protein n=1 Tax=Solimonas fluminis TaxID=2086571 RepID=A0A2S5TB94_9GAMM|nr:zinc ribbon domain-containing protein [Solimonas fluminis]PPE72216.1 zinc ribbon domain-containing protein [Solimonas fluminis]